MHSVRKRILEILKECDGATVAELAERLKMAPVSVRHHLDILQGDNLICVAKVARKGNVGRPKQVYGLTAEADTYFPNNFATLSSGLVRQLKDVLPPDQVKHAFRTMATEMAGELIDEVEDGYSHEADADATAAPSPPEQHLDSVVSFLNKRGYLAQWERAEDSEDDAQSGFLLHKHNCPYIGVSGEHPELCMMDQVLIDELVGCPCKRTRSMVEDGHCCTYFIPLEETRLDERVLDEAVLEKIANGGCPGHREHNTSNNFQKINFEEVK